MSVNQVLLDIPLPLPDTEDIFATLGSGTVLRKIDLSNAYQQMQLSTNSQQYLTVNTHKRLYTYQRLTYGIASAPALFQSTMDQILQGMDNVRCRIDDIIIRTAPHEQLQVLDEVLTRLERHGILAKKSEFMVPSIEFLVDREGRHPTDEKITAISEAPSPVFSYQTWKSTSRSSKADSSDSSDSMIRVMSNCVNCHHVTRGMCVIPGQEWRSGFQVQ